jgi:glutamate-1-semialdehyde 2,1-aminomutase
MRHYSKSRRLFAAACRLLPGGVSSPVRAFRSVGSPGRPGNSRRPGGHPLFIARGKGSRLWDVDGNRYLDYVLSWGPLILGHAHPDVVRAVTAAARKGTSYGAPTEIELELAALIQRAMPSMELVRFVNSGTEATMSALRLARAYTKRDLILKFDGCYHGHADGLLVKAGSGATTLGVPDSPGVPNATAHLTLQASYNDLKQVEALFARHGGEIAAVIVEPIAANMGVVLPADGFLAGLRALTQRHGALLIFDEVLTGFRVAFGGAQALYHLRPDLTCLGKIIGGGLPVGAYGGRKEIMEWIAPVGPVYQAGTLSGNPIAMSAGLATLRRLRTVGFYGRLERRAARLYDGLIKAAHTTGVPIQPARVGSLMGFFFADRPVIDYASAKSADTKRFAAFFWAMLEAGVYIAPSQFEALFVSSAHTAREIDQTVEAAAGAFQRAARIVG